MNVKSYLIKKHFYETIMELLEEKTLKNISVKDICDYSGFSRTTFYRYFKDKNEIISFLYDELVKKEIFNDENKGNFYKQSVISLRLIKENLNFFRRIFEYHGQNSFLEYFYSSIEEYYTDKFKEKNNKITASEEYIIKYNTAGMVNVVNRWIRKDCENSPEEITDIIIKCLSPEIKELVLEN